LFVLMLVISVSPRKLDTKKEDIPDYEYRR